MLEDRRTDLKALADRLGAPRFSFGSAELLVADPGRDARQRHALRAHQRRARSRCGWCWTRRCCRQDPLNYHPLINTKTTAIAPRDLLKFIAACGHEPIVLSLDGLDRAVAAPAG